MNIYDITSNGKRTGVMPITRKKSRQKQKTKKTKMKKNLVKTAFAFVCVVATGIGAFNAYNSVNLSEADMLLAENVEALSWNAEGTASGPLCEEKCEYIARETCMINLWGCIVPCGTGRAK